MISLISEKYTSYQIEKKSNKIQWKCEETYESKTTRSKSLNGYYICNLSYRIIPTELNLFTKIFGNNDWKYVFSDIPIQNEEDFQWNVKDYKTYGDICKYFDEKNSTLWYHP